MTINKILMSKLVIGLLYTVLLFSGCSSSSPNIPSPPKPFSVEVKNIDLPNENKQLALNEALQKKYPYKYLLSSGCFKLTDKYYYNERKFESCFSIKGNKIIREDKAECFLRGKKTYCEYKDLDDNSYNVRNYVQFLNKIDIKKEYIEEVEKAKIVFDTINNKASMPENYKKASTLINNKIKSFSHKLIDPSGVIPKELLNKFDFNLAINTDIMQCYDKYIKNKSLAECRVQGGIKNYSEIIKSSGFSFEIKNPVFNKRMDELSNPIIYEIEPNVKFNFLPKIFSTNNEDIAINVNSDYFINFTITNKTNKFIEIKNISLYWDSDIRSISKNLVLPPNSINKDIKMNILQIKNQAVHKTKYKVIKSLNESTNFGVAIQYVISNKKKNLYDTKTFTVRDLYNIHKNK